MHTFTPSANNSFLLNLWTESRAEDGPLDLQSWELDPGRTICQVKLFSSVLESQLDWDLNAKRVEFRT